MAFFNVKHKLREEDWGNGRFVEIFVADGVGGGKG